MRKNLSYAGEYATLITDPAGATRRRKKRGKTMKFVVMSDIHYISRRMMLPGTPEHIRLQPEVSEQALRQACAVEDADVLLLTGDLTDRGDLLSHEDLIAFLRELKKSGKRIYVTTATHDFCHHRAYTRKYADTRANFAESPWDQPWFDAEDVVYKELVTEDCRDMTEEECAPDLVRPCTPEELWDMYREFGRDDAFSVCESAFSYCVALDDDVWCLMLNDNFRNEEAKHNVSVTYSPACWRWIRSLVKRAKEEGKTLFACTHHPLLPPVPAYKIGAGDRDMRRPEVGHMLADVGVRLVFTGHTHFADVGFLRSKRGSLLCDISTPSVRFYPPRFRVAELTRDDTVIDTRCVTVDLPEGVSLPDASLPDYYRRLMYEEYEGKVNRLPSPLNRIVAELRVKHLRALTGKASGMTAAEYDAIGEKRLFDLIMDLAFNMLAGDGAYTPDTPEYKFLMGLGAVCDSVIDAQPFYDVRRRKLKGYSVREIIEPMLCNKYVPDNDAVFDYTKAPVSRFPEAAFTSHAGDLVMAALCLAAIPLSQALPAAVCVGLPVLTVLKKRKLANDPPRPERY